MKLTKGLWVRVESQTVDYSSGMNLLFTPKIKLGTIEFFSGPWENI